MAAVCCDLPVATVWLALREVRWSRAPTSKVKNLRSKIDRNGAGTDVSFVKMSRDDMKSTPDF